MIDLQADVNRTQHPEQKTANDRITDTRRCQRQAKLFLRSQFGGRKPNDITVQRAVCVDDLCGAYELVHDAYVDKGYLSAHTGGMRLRVYEAMLETATFVAKQGDRVVGVMSLVPDSHDLGLPSESIYGPELAELRRQGRWVGEVTNLAVDPQYRQSELFFKLSQCLYAHAVKNGLDDLFVSISPGHANFFELFLCFEPWGGRRDYGQTSVDWVEGKRLNLQACELLSLQHDQAFGPYAFLHDWFFDENPFFHADTDAQNAPAQTRYRTEALRKLIGIGNLLQRFTHQQCESIRRRFNGEVLQRLQPEPKVTAA